MKQSPEVKAFLEEIRAVCEKHGLVIDLDDCGWLEVWKLSDSPASLIALMEAEDNTK